MPRERVASTEDPKREYEGTRDPFGSTHGRGHAPSHPLIGFSNWASILQSPAALDSARRGPFNDKAEASDLYHQGFLLLWLSRFVVPVAEVLARFPTIV